MCELLGMSFNTPVTPRVSFQGFRPRGFFNPHGWGIALYPGKAAQVLKETVAGERSTITRYMTDYFDFRSRLFISHVRKATVGGIAYENTHPFQRELGGRDYVFAHNGTVHNLADFPLGRYRPIGETDSEHVFCYLMDQFAARGIESWQPADYDWLHKLFARINANGKFNCLMTDGEALFAYYDRQGGNGLCILREEVSYLQLNLLDDDWSITLEQRRYTEHHGYIVATTPLTPQPWLPLKFGELVVFKDGDIVYSSARPVTEVARFKLTPDHLNILHLIRSSPHEVEMGEIIARSRMMPEQVHELIHDLMCQGLVKRDNNYDLEWTNVRVGYSTPGDLRPDIDEILEVPGR